MPTLGTNVIIIRENEILLTLRSDVPIWCLPGGGVEANESVAEAAVREALEETGVMVELTRLAGVYSRPDWGVDGDHVVVFTAHPLGGEPHPADGEAVEARYFPLDELPEPLLWWQAQRIADALAFNGAVACRQEVAWPFGGMTRQEIYERRQQGGLVTPELIAQLSEKPRPEKLIVQVGPG